MITASQMLHGIVGGVGAGCFDADPFACWVCGGMAKRGIQRSAWLGSNFVGQNRARAIESGVVCEACVVVMAGRPPDTLRMYTNLVEGSAHEKLNKGHKPAMRAFLRRRHVGQWFAAIADSGQKHVIPWCPVNPPGSRGGRVMFEEMLVTLPATEDGWGIVDEITALLTMGATKEEIGTGAYGPRAWQLCGATLRAFEERRGRDRLSPWFDLAVWLAQRDEAEVAKRMETETAARAAKKKETSNARRGGKGKAAHADRGDAPGDPGVVSRDAAGERAEALGHDPGQDAIVGADEREPGGVGDEHEPSAEAPCAQRSLFGVAEGADGRRARAKRGR